VATTVANGVTAIRPNTSLRFYYAGGRMFIWAGPFAPAPVSSRGCQLSLGSLVFAASKFKEDLGRLKTTVECALGRNERNRLRVVSMKVNMTLGVAPESLAHLSQTLSQFEDFCTVPQSVQAGIPFTVTVKGPNGRVVK
jgi:hypothetical protein